jgi:hypothetical protein
MIIFILWAQSHTGLISSDSIQITTLTACITLKIQPFCQINKGDIWLKFENNEKNPPGGAVIQKNQKQILKS